MLEKLTNLSKFAQGRLDYGPPVAVIDIGSNSVRLVVYEGITRSPTPLFNEKTLAGLGREVQTKGLLAADALQPPMRWRYMAAWHGIALALLLAVILIARPALLAVGVPAYLAGALAARLTAGLRLSTGIMGTTRPGWTIRSWSHRPLAGAGAAAILLLSLLPVRALGINAMLSLVGIGTALPALMLAGVDDAVVRFMTIAGHETWRIVVRHTKGLASFLALAVPGAGVMIDPVAAGIAAAVGAAVTRAPAWSTSTAHPPIKRTRTATTASGPPAPTAAAVRRSCTNCRAS